MADSPRKGPGRPGKNPQPAGAPQKPARPAAAKRRAATGSAGKAETAQQKATNQTRKDTAKEASQAAGRDDEEGDTWSEVMRQSPSWLASMVFHMILLLLLALMSFSTEPEVNLEELVIGEADVEDIEDLEEETEELDEQLETDVETPSEQEMEDVVAPTELQVDTPMPPIQTAEPEIAVTAAQLDFADIAMDEVMQVDVLKDVASLPASLSTSRTNTRKKATKAGATATSEAAVEAALKWLADHQNRNGSWSWGHTPGDKCSGFEDPGEAKSKMGATGLALLPFLGAGYTHQDGKYKEVVKNGLKYLVGNMVVKNNMGKLYEENGKGHEHMYCHGISACTLVEAYGMTQDSKLRAPAQLGINYIVAAQHPENGGWLYEPRRGGDTSVVGWQVMALKSAVLSNIKVPGHVKALSNRWLDHVQYNVPDGYAIGSH
ncbi:MAG: hypothetical protein GTO53_06780, partial [Planctomycetales bacterium]|nr:hypothetical protein [Planctomycetales bacterium]NIM08842.1 hypothetical protein [Planctomycetales bacterium]NIN08303.1 hypothetical protein [Planctomycetales bacterium]NIN77432.1 hypothetical protein [Planctomycetales bacterium]NIO34606.1 hypothetical protein [Planctomycetales bacterium]